MKNTIFTHLLPCCFCFLVKKKNLNLKFKRAITLL